MNIELYSSLPPVLQFTPEVEAGIQAAAELAFGPMWESEPTEFDIDMMAAQMLANAPELALQILSLGAEKLAKA